MALSEAAKTVTAETFADGGQPISLAHRTIGNVLWKFFSGTWLYLLGLATTPFIVHRLGNEAYGIWCVVGVFIGYLALTDLDLGSSVVKYVAEYHTRQDFPKVQRVVATVLAVYLVIGLVAGGLLILFSKPLVAHVVKVKPEHIGIAWFAFVMAGLGLVLALPGSLYASLPNALQRFDVSSKLSVGFGTFAALATLAVLALGCGLKGVIWLNFFVSLINLPVYYLVVNRIRPGIPCLPQFDKGTFGQLFRFSGLTMIQKVAGTVTFSFDRLVIGSVMSMSAVTYYAVCHSLIAVLMGAVSRFGPVIFPLASELTALGAQDKVRRLHYESVKFGLILVLPFVIVLFAFARPILDFWMGEAFARQGTLPLQILLVGFLFQAMMSIPWNLGNGAGRPGIQTWAVVALFALNAATNLLLVPRMGLVGAALGFAIPYAVVTPVYVGAINRLVVQCSTMVFLKNAVLRPLLAGVVTTAIACCLPFRVAALWQLAVGALLVGIFFFGLLVQVRGLTRADWDLFVHFLLRKTARGSVVLQSVA